MQCLKGGAGADNLPNGCELTVLNPDFLLNPHPALDRLS